MGQQTHVKPESLHIHENAMRAISIMAPFHLRKPIDSKRFTR
jgi:hypothetical protein